MTTPKPAEPADAGSSTPATEPPIWPDDYDLSEQPNQEATEPPEPPVPDTEQTAAPRKAAKKAAPRKAAPKKDAEDDGNDR